MRWDAHSAGHGFDLNRHMHLSVSTDHVNITAHGEERLAMSIVVVHWLSELRSC